MTHQKLIRSNGMNQAYLLININMANNTQDSVLKFSSYDKFDGSPTPIIVKFGETPCAEDIYFAPL